MPTLRLFFSLALAGVASLFTVRADDAAEAEAAVDHRKLIESLGPENFARGEKLYAALCLACHGTPTAPGSLPTSRAFWREPFKNGGDPFSLYQTLTKGLGAMPPWPMLTPDQRHDVVHYIREEFVKKHDPAKYVPVTPEWLATLPKPQGEFHETAAMKAYAAGPPYLRMDFGPVLFWTLQAEKGNIAYKGIAIRLDEGAGGVSKGRAWALYDHDTMRLAAVWTGNKFVDWRGIAFDGSHGTHTSIAGKVSFINPPGPGWAEPSTGTWDDPRLRGLDDKPYGPLPSTWARYRGLHLHGSRAVISYDVGGTTVLESPGTISDEKGNISFVRRLEIGPGTQALELRVSPEAAQPTLAPGSAGELATRDGFAFLRLPPREKTAVVELRSPLPAVPGGFAPQPVPDGPLAALTRGGATRWPTRLVTHGRTLQEKNGFAVDELPLPETADNPWRTQFRLGGLDFFADGRRAAVCSWMGDVWIVSGLDGDLKELTWQRIASGLCQPLGVKIVDENIYVTCRDQIVRLRDDNGDGEADFIDCFNNDQQVTEHFHEFAMGLQTDKEGNFYYAKSARHALPPLVPQHGTLLRVSRDGSRTDILANGFRAANGICVNDDGTFFVTDQEGHWTPKNRINLVKPGNFYGNMWSYGAPPDKSDAAMAPPMVWITNEMDRSPGELVRVTSPAWKRGGLQLLNLSYGMGRMFNVLQDAANPAQGGVVALPLDDFVTGVMRGRFHPGNGHLYACGMAVWATNKSVDGGLYRLRKTEAPAWLPTGFRSAPGRLDVTFSDPLPAGNAGNWQLHAWKLARSANYGSPHVDEHPVPVKSATLSADGRTVSLEVPDLAPTPSLALEVTLRDAAGAEFTREIHLTLHTVGTP